METASGRQPHFYAIEAQASGPTRVHRFTSKRARDAWVRPGGRVDGGRDTVNADDVLFGVADAIVRGDIVDHGEAE